MTKRIIVCDFCRRETSSVNTQAVVALQWAGLNTWIHSVQEPRIGERRTPLEFAINRDPPKHLCRSCIESISAIELPEVDDGPA